MFESKLETFIFLFLCVNTLLAQVAFDDEDLDDDDFIFEKFTAGSTDDLGRLFDLEKQLLASLDRCMIKAKKDDIEKVQKFYADNKIDKGLLLRQDTLAYTAHPINAYHLMKRTTVLWPELFDRTSDNFYSDVEDIVERFPFQSDFNYGATFGLMSVQLYYHLNFTDLAKGLLVYPLTGEKFQSLHTLSSEDFLLVAGTATYVLRYDKAVQWTSAAVQVAKQFENATDMTLRRIRQKVEQAKLRHDDVLIQKGLGSVLKLHEGAYDGLPEAPIFTESRPFDEELLDSPTYQKSRRKMREEMDISKLFVDIRPFDEKDPSLFMEKSFHRMWQTMQPISKRLCNGDSSLRPASYDRDLKCIYLHYHHPYLRLGPFKYEPLHSDPHVGIFRDFYTEMESDVLRNNSHGKLHSTEFKVGGESRYYTSQRVSKRHNLEEDDHPLILASSKKMSLATRWMIHQKTYSAEDYKMINYGLGGHIEVHADYWGPGKFLHPGGARVVTFMGYMNSVTAGGFTVFPSLGLFVQPSKGDALFWLTERNDAEYDSRMFHLGCPVLVGHKWVLTKWLYADDQLWNHPCEGVKGGNFPNFSNSQRYREGFKI